MHKVSCAGRSRAAPPSLARVLIVLALSSLAVPGARAAETEVAERPPEVPLVAVVALKEQSIAVYDSTGPIMKGAVSTGQREYETPAGIFTILQKNRDHASNLYDAEMPFMQRLTWSGVALHAGALPGYRASHGCIRLGYKFAERLFDLSSVGTRVVIAPRATTPERIDHPLLERLRDAGKEAASPQQAEVARQEATQLRETAAAIAEKATAAAAKVRTATSAKAAAQRRLSAALARNPQPDDTKALARIAALRAELESKSAELELATSGAQAAAAEQQSAEQRAELARLRAWPTSMMLSLATQRLYVRQGFESVLELPIAVRDPERPIGTQVFYATESAAGERGWMGISLHGNDVAPALDRITIPDEAARLLARGQWLGTMLVVTDEPPHKETGTGTDLIVVLSDEPQGALKIRPPQRDVPVAAPAAETSVRAYRPAADDAHFRHPLGGFP